MPSLDDARDTAQAAYSACADALADPDMAAVVAHGLTVCYGPVLARPALAVLSFQGGGADPAIQREPPARLLYAHDPYKFGTALRRYADGAGLAEVIQTSTIAHPVIFPQAPTAEAGRWLTSRGPRGAWRQLSQTWVARLIEAQRPRAMIVFGDKAGAALPFGWRDEEFRHSQNHRTFARGEWRGIPAIYCHHLSIGCPAAEAEKCFHAVRHLIEES